MPLTRRAAVSPLGPPSSRERPRRLRRHWSIFPQDAGPNKLACFPGGGDAVGDDGGAPGDAGDTFGHRAVDRGLVDNHGTGQNVSAREGAREAKRLCLA